MRMVLSKLGGIFSVTKTPECGTKNFMSWERFDREVLKDVFPKEYVSQITVSDRGMEFLLERLPEAKDGTTQS